MTEALCEINVSEWRETMMKWVKKKMFRPVVFLLTILFTGAPGAAWADNIPPDRTVVLVYTYDKFAVIKFSPAFANNLGCGGGSIATTHAAILWGDDPDKKVKFASVLMAMSLNLRIGFGISGWIGLFGGIPIVYRVDVAE